MRPRCLGVLVEAVELRRVELALVEPFRTSFGVVDKRDLLLVRLVGDESEGWGECVAMAEPTYTSEYVAGAHQVARDHLVPRLLAAQRVEAADVASLLAPVKGHPMAKAALEVAVLDAELRAAGRSLGSFLGATRERVEVGVSVGISSSVGALLDEVDRHVADGYRRVKLKIEPGWDLEPVGAVRDRFGSTPLQVDANGAYRRSDIAHLVALDHFDLLLIEQPFVDHDLDAHAALAREIRTPVCLDESITSARDAEAALAAGACSVVNIKPGRVGGHLEAARIHDLCRDRGVPVWCGGMFESGIGRAANLALAALPNFSLPGDLSASARYFHRDLTPPFELCDGCLTVPDGPGIGVEPDPQVLAAATVSVELLRR